MTFLFRGKRLSDASDGFRMLGNRGASRIYALTRTAFRTHTREQHTHLARSLKSLHEQNLPAIATQRWEMEKKPKSLYF